MWCKRRILQFLRVANVPITVCIKALHGDFVETSKGPSILKLTLEVTSSSVTDTC